MLVENQKANGLTAKRLMEQMKDTHSYQLAYKDLQKNASANQVEFNKNATEMKVD